MAKVSHTVVTTQALQQLHRDNAEAQGRLVELANKAEQRANATTTNAERRVREAEDASGVVQTEGQRAAMRRVGDQIRYSPALYPWMRAYAEWLTLECIEPPKRSQRTMKARSFAHAPINNTVLLTLEARADFVAYTRDLENGPLERARNRFQAAFPEYVEAHKEALDLARDAKDYNAVARIAEPVLDRVLPKKAENAAAASVTIVLAPEQMKAIATYEAPAMLVDTVVAQIEP
jgi:hypothetical protein